MNIAVVGGDFRSLILSYKLRNKGNNVTLFCGENHLGGFLRGINIFGNIVDLGPQYLDNFNQQDKQLIEGFGDDANLSDLTFSYSNFISGKLSSENMALPSWYNCFEKEELLSILSDRAKRFLNQKKKPQILKNLKEHFELVGGKYIENYQESLCKKFYGVESHKVDKGAAPIIPFASSRQVLFKGETSNLLKKSMECLDATLAAPKTLVTDALFNLYPEKSYREMLTAFEKKLKSLDINIFVNTKVTDIKISSEKLLLETDHNNKKILEFDNVYFGMDERISENVLFKSNKLNDLTHFVPQHFIYMQCPKKAIGNLNYIFDYDLDHVTTRVTDLSYCLQKNEETILCAEVTALGNNKIDENNCLENIIEKCKNEVSQISFQINKKDLKPNINQIKSITAPKTYRIPLLGYSNASENFKKTVLQEFKGKVKVFPWMHTRKEMLESLKDI